MGRRYGCDRRVEDPPAVDWTANLRWTLGRRGKGRVGRRVRWEGGADAFTMGRALPPPLFSATESVILFLFLFPSFIFLSSLFCFVLFLISFYLSCLVLCLTSHSLLPNAHDPFPTPPPSRSPPNSPAGLSLTTVSSIY